MAKSAEEDFRNHIRSVAHSKGLEEAMKHLRSREDMYQEYDNFYTVYTYRAKLRNSAICDKEKFEDLVREIQ